MSLWRRRRTVEPPLSARQRQDDARFDAVVARTEHYGRCHDCEVGEPHACPDAHDRATRLYAIATDMLAEYDAMFEACR